MLFGRIEQERGSKEPSWRISGAAFESGAVRSVVGFEIFSEPSTITTALLVNVGSCG